MVGVRKYHPIQWLFISEADKSGVFIIIVEAQTYPVIIRLYLIETDIGPCYRIFCF